MTSHLFFSEKIAAILALDPRIQWFLFINREPIDHNTLWSEPKVEKFARLVDGMILPITLKGRDLTAVCFQVDSTSHLIIAHRELRLCFILPSPIPRYLDEIAAKALALLHQCAGELLEEIPPIQPDSADDRPDLSDSPAASEEPPLASTEELAESAGPHATEWPEFRNFLIEVLGKILSRPQAERLLMREIQNLGITGTPQPEHYESIARSLVAHIPHRGKQAALLTEVLLLLES